MKKSYVPQVAIIILNWNAWQDTIECLESIQHLNHSDFKIILIDNGSVDGSLEKIKEWCKGKIEVNTDFIPYSPELKPVNYIEYESKKAEEEGQEQKESELNSYPSNRKMIIIRSQENLGFSEGNNLAIRYLLKSSPLLDYVLLLNNDSRIDPQCVSRLVDVSKKHNAGIVGSIIKDTEGIKTLFNGDHRRHEMFYLPYVFFRHKLQNDEPSSMVWGTCMLVRKSVLVSMEKEKGYFFNPKLFLYMEDNEFCMTAAQLGFKIYIAKDAVIYHKGSESCVNQKYQRSLLYYYVSRNTISIAKALLTRKWLALFHIYYPLARLKDIVLKLVQRRTKEAFAIFEGTKDGYCHVEGRWQKH